MPKSVSQFVGSVGDRLTVSAMLISVFFYKTHFSYYGETHYIYKFADENGNVFVWKTSSFQDLTENDKYTLTGTVKEHSEYKGEKQTMLIRCRIK